jgi:hypothetical protein
MATTNIYLRSEGIQDRAYLYIGVTSSSGEGCAGCLGRVFRGYRDGDMQDPASELPRIYIPRTPVNKGKQKDLMVQQLKGGGHSDRLLETSSHLTKRDSA